MGRMRNAAPLNDTEENGLPHQSADWFAMTHGTSVSFFYCASSMDSMIAQTSGVSQSSRLSPLTAKLMP